MNEHDTDDGQPLVSNRTMEIVVALLLLAICGIVLYDSVRLGFGWQEGAGPAAGYFPFWIAVILGISSFVVLVQALFFRLGAGEIFVAVRPFGRVLAVLVPSLVYVALIGGIYIGPVEVPGLGIYVASALFIFAFMLIVGREPLLMSIAVAVGVPVGLFFMFEKWFLVPLPKGPLEEHLEIWVHQLLSLVGL